MGREGGRKREGEGGRERRKQEHRRIQRVVEPEMGI